MAKTYRGGGRRTEGLKEKRQQQTEGITNSMGERLLFNPLPLCFRREYRGSAHRARGLKKQRGLEYKQAPDNCGSPSGFIPLAAKKNKRIESIIMP